MLMCGKVLEFQATHGAKGDLYLKVHLDEKDQQPI